jgi:two-component system, OmpR family, sensor histidine kinase KdpD
MNTLFLLKETRPLKQLVKEIFFIFGSTLLLTMTMVVFRLPTRDSNSLLLYLLLVFVFACVYGLRSALIASFVAFITQDYFFVQPLYSFVIAKLEDTFGLLVFLITAVVTSQLASSLRLYALQARQREDEARTLYEFMRATHREINGKLQLTILLKAIVDVFASEGLRDCALFLPDTSNTLHPLNSPLPFLRNVPLLLGEEAAIDWTMAHGRSVDLYDCVLAPLIMAEALSLQNKQMEKRKTSRKYLIRLLPLRTETKVYGVLRLLIEEKRERTSSKGSLKGERLSPSTQEIFFSTFLEQAITVLEQERLRDASIRLEVLQQTEVLRSALFSSVSHDLRTPLATIKAATSNLLQDETLREHNSSINSALLIEREVDRLDGLVENVLDMSRIEAGSLRLEKVWYPLDELVSDTVSRMQVLLGKREVHLNYADDLPPVELDAVQIEQVIFNLLENALRYTPEGSPIEIGIQYQEKHLLVSVADRGSGIPLSEQERIFQKFYRLPQNGSTHSHPQGLGLGLAICRGIIQAHDGQIWVETCESGGAIFSFTLPFHGIAKDDIDE